MYDAEGVTMNSGCIYTVVVHLMSMIDPFDSRLSFVNYDKAKTLALGHDREGRVTLIISLCFRF